LASIPQDVAHYGGRIAEHIDRYTNSIASDIRDALHNSSWIPDSIRPPQSVRNYLSASRPPPPQTFSEKSIAWVSNNRTSIAVFVAVASTTYYLAQRQRKAHARKRRAKKLPNGAKKEIIVLVCSTFHDPLTRSLALDLERRGYVVYVTVSSTEEDSLIQQESKADLRPLWMDLTSTVPNPAVDTHPNLEPIKELLTQHQPQASSGRAGPGSSMGNMSLAGIVVFPGCSGYPVGPLATLPPTDIIDTLNTRLLSPLLSIQQFLPLLSTHSTDPLSPSSIVIAYPSIPASLTPPRQTPESIITTSLSTMATSLRRELAAMRANITVHELKLGNFDLATISQHTSTNNRSPIRNQNRNASTSPLLNPANSQLTHQPSAWHSSQRAAFQRSQHQSPSSSSPSKRLFLRGSSARELHNAVFDALAPPQSYKPFGRWDWTFTKTSSTTFVGSGARTYHVIGEWVPQGFMGMLLTIRERRKAANEWQNLSAVRRKQQDELSAAEAGEGLGPSRTESPAGGYGRGSEIGVNESGIWEKV
jgi:hypothetical protein